MKHYREELAGLDKKGQEMDENYRELLVSECYNACSDTYTLYTHACTHIYCMYRNNLESLPTLIQKISSHKLPNLCHSSNVFT